MGVAVLQHIRYYHRLVPLNAYTSFLPAGWHFIWYFAFTPINVKFTKMPQFKFLQSIRIDSDFDCLFDVVCWYHPTLYHHHSTPRLLNAEETTNRRRQRQRPQWRQWRKRWKVIKTFVNYTLLSVNLQCSAYNLRENFIEWHFILFVRWTKSCNCNRFRLVTDSIVCKSRTLNRPW